MRRALAALVAALTVALVAHLALTRPAPDDEPALVAVRELPVGHVVTASDVEVRLLPPRALPDGVLTGTDQAVGRTLGAPLAAGSILDGTALSSSGLLTGLEGEQVGVYLPLAEPSVPASLVASDRVDVHSPVDGSVVVSGALVVRTSTGDRPGLWLAVDRPGAAALAAARGADPAGASLQLTVLPADGR